MIEHKDFYDFLEKLASMVAETFGHHCEVAISDLNTPESAILAIFNGHVTGRNVGDPLVPQARERALHCADGYFINYKDVKSAKSLKTSTLIFEKDGLNLALCINYDCEDLEKIQHSLSSFLAVQTDDDLHVSGNYAPIIEETMKEALKMIGKPVRLLDKKDRLKIISYLEGKGVLQMQKSIQAVALYLGISRYTVYNYLNELNNNKDV